MIFLAQQLMSGLKTLVKKGILSPWNMANMADDADTWIHTNVHQIEWNIHLFTVGIKLVQDALDTLSVLSRNLEL